MISIRPTASFSSWWARFSTLALALLLAVVLAITLGASIAHAATFTVSNTNDSGDGSLREAVTDANATPNAGSADNIEFDIQSGCDATNGVCTISPGSLLPEITESVIVDGYTQDGASANTLSTGNDAVLKIELSGAGAGSGASGIVISGPSSVVRGLIINRWSGDGVRLIDVDASGNRIEGNFIGTDSSGQEDLGNGDDGVQVDGAPNNVVGGTSPAARNVISGNGYGVYVSNGEASGNRIQGNYVGTDADGTADLGNDRNGVLIDGAPDNTVGGTTAGARNVISANGEDGVLVSHTGANGNTIEGNYIGTDASGSVPLGNDDVGVEIEEAQNNAVGGTTAGARNVISANGSAGVLVIEESASGNEIQGNYVGTSASGQGELGNDLDGVAIVEAPNNLVGGTSAAAANLISNSGFNGVFVEGSDATGNSIRRNSIFDNEDLGIGLEGGDGNPSGVTPNDPQDPDDGPNLLQNFPVITSATTPNGRSVSVQGTLNSNPNESYIIQFFSSPTRDPSGYGEGKTFLGQTNVTANAGGNAAFSFSANAPVAAGEFVTATATNAATGDTSEFSRAVGVQDETRPTVVSTNPQNGATGVPARADVFATFSEAMNPATINPNTFKLFLQEEGGGQTQVAAAVSYNEEARRARLNPNANLTPGARYVGLVTERARDLAGNPLAQRRTFYFVVAR